MPSRTDTAQDPAAGEGDISLLSVALMLARNGRLLFLTPVVAGAAGLAVGVLLPKKYEAASTIVPPQTQASSTATLAYQLGALAGVAGLRDNVGMRTSEGYYLAMLESDVLADRLVARFNLTEHYQTGNSVTARRQLRAATVIGSDAKKGIIRIAVSDLDPKQAAALANGYPDELKRLAGEYAIAIAVQRRELIERQLGVARQQLAEAESQLKQDQRFGSGAGSRRLLPLFEAEQAARLNTQIFTLEAQLGAMRSYLADTHSDVRRLRAQLAALRQQLAKMETGMVAISRTDTSHGATYLSRLQAYTQQERLYDAILQQVDVARIEEAREGALVQVLDPAQVPTHATAPRIVRMAVLSAVVGLLGALGLIVARQALAVAVRDSESARKLEAIRASLRPARARPTAG